MRTFNCGHEGTKDCEVVEQNAAGEVIDKEQAFLCPACIAAVNTNPADPRYAFDVESNTSTEAVTRAAREKAIGAAVED